MFAPGTYLVPDVCRASDPCRPSPAALVCSADHRATSDVVPIAVGVALASLVVIILIAYIVGRRRARQRGYQSV